jgi:hypothetical protein
MAGDTIKFNKGSTFNVGGQLFKSGDVPFDYSDGTLDVYDTLGVKLPAVQVLPNDPAQGTFFVTITDEESQKLQQGRMTWFKLRLKYTVPAQSIVFPMIWIDAQ